MSRDKSVIVTRSVGLTSLINSTVSFLTAFGLEVLLYSDGLRARLPVGALLVMVVLLIFWCIWTTLEARVNFSLFGRVCVLKDGLVSFMTRRLSGKTSGPRSDVGGAAGSGGQGKIEMLAPRLSEGLKEVFNRLHLSRRSGDSISPAFVNPTGNDEHGLPHATAVEMGDIAG